MPRCKNSECKKEALPGEEYCCACRDIKDRKTRTVLKVCVGVIVAAAVGVWAWITNDDSANV